MIDWAIDDHAYLIGSLALVFKLRPGWMCARFEGTPQAPSLSKSGHKRQTHFKIDVFCSLRGCQYFPWVRAPGTLRGRGCHVF
jgi:hypothetical protein